MAFVSCLAVMVVLKLMQRIVHVKTYKRLEVQFVHRTETLNDIKELFSQKHVTILDQDFHAENIADGHSLYTNVYTLTLPGTTSYQELITVLSEHPNVKTVRTRNV